MISTTYFMWCKAWPRDRISLSLAQLPLNMDLVFLNPDNPYNTVLTPSTSRSSPLYQVVTQPNACKVRGNRMTVIKKLRKEASEDVGVVEVNSSPISKDKVVVRGRDLTPHKDGCIVFGCVVSCFASLIMYLTNLWFPTVTRYFKH